MIAAIYVLVSIIILFYLYRRRKLYWLSWKLDGPFALPLIGNGLYFFCNDDDLLDKTVSICNKYPSPFRLWFGPKFTVVIKDADQAQKVMSSYNFITKDPDVYKFLEPFDGKGLITSSGLKWKRDRRFISPILIKKNVLQYFETINEQTKILVHLLKKQVDKPVFNVEPYIHKCTADFVNRSLLGLNTRAQFGELDKFLKLIHRMYTIIHARIVKVWLQNDLLFRFTKYWKEHEKGKRVILGFIDKAIENTTLSTANQNFQPIIDQLKDIRCINTGFFNTQDLRDHLVTLYSASEDTITSITSFTLVLLGMYPKIQEKVIAEIYEIIGKEGKSIQRHDLDKFEYLDMVLKDVLRLFPIASFLVRKSEKEVFLTENCLIPEGCSIIVSIFNIHRNKQYWEKPNEFFPEHFLLEAIKNRHPYAYMPFSAGLRGCIGKPFAFMALRILVVTILQNFIVESKGTLDDLELKTDISIRPKNESFLINLKKRLS